MREILVIAVTLAITARSTVAMLPEDLVARFGMVGYELLLDFCDVAQLGLEFSESGLSGRI